MASRKVSKVVIGCTCLAAGYAVYDSSIRRQLKFWSKTAPIVFDYVKTNYSTKTKTAEERTFAFNKLHEKHAKRSLEIILDLRGLFIKAGQVCSVRPEFVPEAYRQQFRKCQSDVPTEVEFAVIEKVVKEDLGISSLDQIFVEFNEVPVGCASIGQAHVAKLKAAVGSDHENVEETVIVKIQYPNANALVNADIQSLKILTYLAAPDVLPAFEEFSKQIKAELDYKREANNLEAIYNCVMPEYNQEVDIPILYRTLTNNRIITMSFIPGEKLDRVLFQKLESIGIHLNGSGDLNAVQSIIKGDDLRSVNDQKEIFSTKIVDAGIGKDEPFSLQTPASNHTHDAILPPSTPGYDEIELNDERNILISPVLNLEANSSSSSLISSTIEIVKKNLAYLVFKGIKVDNLLAVYRIAISVRTNVLFLVISIVKRLSSFGFLSARQELWLKEKSVSLAREQTLSVVTEKINVMFQVHGFEIFHCGLFNADAHPGNLILVDGTNKIGLIDYGQCKQIGPDFQAKFSKLMVELTQGNSDEEIASILRSMGVKTQNDTTLLLATFARMAFCKIESKFLDPNFHHDLIKKDRIAKFPPDLVMISRLAAILRGLSLTLGQNVSVAEQWLPFAQEYLEKSSAYKRKHEL